MHRILFTEFSNLVNLRENAHHNLAKWSFNSVQISNLNQKSACKTDSPFNQNFHRSSSIVRVSDTETPAKQSLFWPFRFSLTHALFTRWRVNNAHKREIAGQSDWLKHQHNIRIYVITMQFKNFHWLYQYGQWMRDVLKCFLLF